MKPLVPTLLLFAFLVPTAVSAQQVLPFSESIFRAQVTDITSFGEKSVEGTDLSTPYQNLSARILDGAKAGQTVTFENDSPSALSVGEMFYLRFTPAVGTGPGTWSVEEPDRLNVLLWLLIGFVVVTIVVGGMAGLRALIALAGSILIIVFGLLPALAAGAAPALTSGAFAALILAFSMFVTHKVRRETFVAFFASVIALLFAIAVADAAVLFAHLSGFVSDEAADLHFMTNGALNLTSLLLGGILIGIVGVLNDISVSQVHTVAEIIEANPTQTRGQVLRKAVRVGREHLGAVVNMLPLAYVGAALPLLLLFQDTAGAPFLFVINREVFASEVIRILAGGIALSLSGAIATLLAVLMLVKRKKTG